MSQSSPIKVMQGPLVVLSTARSGTTALTQSLMAAYGGFPYVEASVLPLLARILKTERQYFEDLGEAYSTHPRHLISRFSREGFRNALQSFFVDFYRAEFPDDFWIDKTATAEMIRFAPVVAELFPAARFISLQRSGIDVLSSRKHKFPESSFEEGCLEWRDAVQAFAAVKDILGDRCFEIEQQDMLCQPGPLSLRLGRFLGFSESQQKELRRIWKNARPEQRTPRRKILPLKLQDADWTPEEKRLFLSLCGDAMASCGYAV